MMNYVEPLFMVCQSVCGDARWFKDTVITIIWQGETVNIFNMLIELPFLDLAFCWSCVNEYVAYQRVISWHFWKCEYHRINKMGTLPGFTVLEGCAPKTVSGCSYFIGIGALELAVLKPHMRPYILPDLSSKKELWDLFFFLLWG